MVDNLKHFIIVGNIDHRAVRKNTLHGSHETAPLIRAMKIINDQEATLEQVFPQYGNFFSIQTPATDFHGIQEGIIENISILQIYQLAAFHITHVYQRTINLGQPGYTIHEIVFRFRHINCPAAATPEVASPVDQAGKVKLCPVRIRGDC